MTLIFCLFAEHTNGRSESDIASHQLGHCSKSQWVIFPTSGGILTFSVTVLTFQVIKIPWQFPAFQVGRHPELCILSWLHVLTPQGQLRPLKDPSAFRMDGIFSCACYHKRCPKARFTVGWHCLLPYIIGTGLEHKSQPQTPSYAPFSPKANSSTQNLRHPAQQNFPESRDKSELNAIYMTLGYMQKGSKNKINTMDQCMQAMTLLLAKASVKWAPPLLEGTVQSPLHRNGTIANVFGKC